MEDKMAAGAFGRAWSYGCEYIFKIIIIPPPLRNRLLLIAVLWKHDY